MPSQPHCVVEGCVEHYACRLRNKGLQVSPRAQSTRTLNWRPTPSIPPKSNGALLYDTRPDGSKMPVLREDGSHVYVREAREAGGQVESTIRRIRNSGTAP